MNSSIRRALRRRRANRPVEPLRPGARGDEERDGRVDDVDRRRRQADEHRQVEPGRGEAAEEERDEGRGRAIERLATSAIRIAVKPWVGRKPLTRRPFGPSTSIVPARPASAPQRTKPASPRRESLAPCQTIMIGLRPARLESTPKEVRLTSTHIADADERRR